MAGGLTKGKSHAKGGIKMKVKSTGQNIEVEGGEGIINKHTMSSKDKHTYEGKEMTACEIASDLNQKTGNGVSFDCDETDNTDMTPTDPSTGFAKGGKPKRKYKKKKMAKSKKKTGAYAKLVSKIMKRDGIPYREAQKKAKDEYVSGATSQKKKPKKTYKGRVDNLKSKSATKISYSGRPKKSDITIKWKDGTKTFQDEKGNIVTMAKGGKVEKYIIVRGTKESEKYYYQKGTNEYDYKWLRSKKDATIFDNIKQAEKAADESDGDIVILGTYAKGGEVDSISELYEVKKYEQYPYGRDLVAHFIYGDDERGNLIVDATNGRYTNQLADYSELSDLMLGYEYTWRDEGNMREIDGQVRDYFSEIGILDYYAKGGKVSADDFTPYARICDVTGEGMNEGWLMGDSFYVKYEKDLIKELRKDFPNQKDLSDNELMEEAYEEEYYYYTEWEDPSDVEYVEYKGKLYEKDELEDEIPAKDFEVFKDAYGIIFEEDEYAKGGDVSGKPVVESIDKIVSHYNGEEFDLDNYPPKSGSEWMPNAMELSLEEAKQFAKELDYELEYSEDVEDAENLQDLQYAILEDTEEKANHDNTYNASWWGGVVDFFVLERKEDDGYGEALVILRMHRGGDPRGNYYGYQAFKLNSFIEDFPAYFARLTYQINTNQGTITLDTEDTEGYTLLVVEDETGTFEVDDNVSIDDVDDKLDMNEFNIY